MLKWRLIQGGFLIALFAGLAWLDFNMNFGRPGLWMVPLALVCAGMGAAEMLELFKTGNLPVRPAGVIGGTLAVLAAASVPVWWPDFPRDCPVGKLGLITVALAVGTAIAFVCQMRRYRQPGEAVVSIALAVFTMVYLGAMMGILVQLRILGGNAQGMSALVATIAIVKCSDMGAFFVGRTFGRNKLSPRISPGKSIEGAIGALVTAVAISGLLFTWLIPQVIWNWAPETAWWRWTLFGLIVCIAGMVGDLAESLIKRDLGAKDSSRWMGGLGGVLDFIDSILFAAPAAYLAWVAGLVGDL